ncbi:MAG: hypothetical protein AB7S75_19225 [Desulfococcaceae bacterium]
MTMNLHTDILPGNQKTLFETLPKQTWINDFYLAGGTSLALQIAQLDLLPQGKPEAAKRALNMVRAMDALGFGNCTNERECEAECPKEITIVNIARLNREFLKASFFSDVR